MKIILSFILLSGLLAPLFAQSEDQVDARAVYQKTDSNGLPTNTRQPIQIITKDYSTAIRMDQIVDSTGKVIAGQIFTRGLTIFFQFKDSSGNQQLINIGSIVGDFYRWHTPSGGAKDLGVRSIRYRAGTELARDDTAAGHQYIIRLPDASAMQIAESQRNENQQLVSELDRYEAIAKMFVEGTDLKLSPTTILSREDGKLITVPVLEQKNFLAKLFGLELGFDGLRLERRRATYSSSSGANKIYGADASGPYQEKYFLKATTYRGTNAGRSFDLVYSMKNGNPISPVLEMENRNWLGGRTKITGYVHNADQITFTIERSGKIQGTRRAQGYFCTGMLGRLSDEKAVVAYYAASQSQPR